MIRFERPLPGFVGFRLYWFGRIYCSIWVDEIKLLEEPLPTEADQINDIKLGTPLNINHDNPKTLVWAGVYNWSYRIPEVIAGYCDMGELPNDATELFKYDAMLFSEIVMGNLQPNKRLLLSEFVKSGGGLVFLGGVYGYGKSHVHVSPLLMDILPVKTQGLWDLREAPCRWISCDSDNRTL